MSSDDELVHVSLSPDMWDLLRGAVGNAVDWCEEQNGVDDHSHAIRELYVALFGVRYENCGAGDDVDGDDE